MTTDFESTRARFVLPDGVIYLDGNSLGPLPRAAEARLAQCLSAEWGNLLIRGWNAAGWMAMPDRLADRIAPLIGAGPGEVALGDTLTVKAQQALAAALALRPDRRVILSDTGNFPSDLYAAQSLAQALGQGYALRVVAPEEVSGSLGPDVAALMLTEVDFRTGRLWDMAGMSQTAHDAGALAVWNLAHSAGALPVDLTGSGADFAMGCTYKYLNGGPGAPAFLWAAPRHVEAVIPLPAGWMGHARPFAFEQAYYPAPGSARFRVGTPPVLQMAALDAALDVWDDVDMGDLRARSIVLSEAFRHGVAAACPTLTLVSPENPQVRGSQLSFRHPQGYAVIQALIDRGVIGDFRAPDMLRFGFAPLYNTLDEVAQALAVLAEILDGDQWDRPAYHRRLAVT